MASNIGLAPTASFRRMDNVNQVPVIHGKTCACRIENVSVELIGLP